MEKYWKVQLDTMRRHGACMISDSAVMPTAAERGAHARFVFIPALFFLALLFLLTTFFQVTRVFAESDFDITDIRLSTDIAAAIVTVEDDITFSEEFLLSVESGVNGDVSASPENTELPSSASIPELPEIVSNDGEIKDEDGEPTVLAANNPSTTKETEPEGGSDHRFVSKISELSQPEKGTLSSTRSVDKTEQNETTADPGETDKDQQVAEAAEIEPSVAVTDEIRETDQDVLTPGLETKSKDQLITGTVENGPDTPIPLADNSAASDQPEEDPSIDQQQAIAVEITDDKAEDPVFDEPAKPVKIEIAANVNANTEVQDSDADQQSGADISEEAKSEASDVPDTSEPATVAAATADPDTVTPAVIEQQKPSINEDEIILSWAIAWSNNDIDAYLSFYAEQFTPADPNQDRAAWEALRRKRLKNKQIKITVSNAEIYKASDNVTEVRFTQRYTSASYRDKIIKSIEMIATEDGWKFISEKTIKTLPFN